jgi:hypothetical protein
MICLIDSVLLALVVDRGNEDIGLLLVIKPEGMVLPPTEHFLRPILKGFLIPVPKGNLGGLLESFSDRWV